MVDTLNNNTNEYNFLELLYYTIFWNLQKIKNNMARRFSKPFKDFLHTLCIEKLRLIKSVD